jgi:hypothetical protein
MFLVDIMLKVKATPRHAGTEGRHGIKRLLVISTRPRRLYPTKDTISIVEELGWVSWPVKTHKKNVAHNGIRPRTVQPIAISYTDYTIDVIRCRTYLE